MVSEQRKTEERDFWLWPREKLANKWAKTEPGGGGGRRNLKLYDRN